MKRYLLFYGDQYYPAGGWNDFHGDFDSIEEALTSFNKDAWDWWHVVDIETKREVVDTWNGKA